MTYRRPYFGWFIVASSAFILAIVLGATYSIFGLLVYPVSREFGLDRADINTALIMLNIGVAVVAPIIGHVLDRVSARRVMITCSILFGSSLVALGQSHSVLLSAVIILLPLSIGVIGTGTLTVSVLIARWFVAQRGRAMTLSMIGASLGGLTVAPVTAWLIESSGWRSALTWLGLSLTLVLLALAFTVRDRPRPDEHETRSAAAAQHRTGGRAQAPLPAIGVAGLMRSGLFWTVSIAAALGMAVPTAISVSLVPLVQERGFSAMQGASLIAVSAAGAIAGKLLVSLLADRFDRTLLLTMLILLVAVPAAGFVLGDSFVVLGALTALLGFATGVIAPLFYTLLADRFGVETFGTVRGMVAPVTAVISAIGVRFIGEMHDLTGDYRLGLQILVAVSVCAALIMLASSKVALSPGTAPS